MNHQNIVYLYLEYTIKTMVLVYGGGALKPW